MIQTLSILHEKEKIVEAQRKFVRLMHDYAEKKGRIMIGGKGFHDTVEVSWSPQLGIWWTTYSLENRYENAFGVEEPKWGTKSGHSIPSIIDIPFEGINRRIGGAFAIDENKTVYLMHRGRIGGGKEGIGKKLFEEKYRGEWETVRDGNCESRLVLIADLDSGEFPQQIAHFVHDVQRLKGEDSQVELDNELTKTFKEEFSGTKEYIVGKIKASCNHGLVVGELARKLEQQGIVAGNVYPMDLYALNRNGQISSLFEVKTDSATSSYYEAIGQLFFYSAKLSTKPKLIAVFPASIESGVEDAFRDIGIEILTFEWVENKPCFADGEISRLMRA